MSNDNHNHTNTPNGPIACNICNPQNVERRVAREERRKHASEWNHPSSGCLICSPESNDRRRAKDDRRREQPAPAGAGERPFAKYSAEVVRVMCLTFPDIKGDSEVHWQIVVESAIASAVRDAITGKSERRREQRRKQERRVKKQMRGWSNLRQKQRRQAADRRGKA